MSLRCAPAAPVLLGTLAAHAGSRGLGHCFDTFRFCCEGVAAPRVLVPMSLQQVRDALVRE